MTETTNRPEAATDEAMEYLFTLRESGQCNMFGAWQYVSAEFDLGPADAKAVTEYWMHNFRELEAARSTT